jgi:hypothetical protein
MLEVRCSFSIPDTNICAQNAVVVNKDSNNLQPAHLYSHVVSLYLNLSAFICVNLWLSSYHSLMFVNSRFDKFSR